MNLPSSVIRTLWKRIEPEPLPTGEVIELFGNEALLSSTGEENGWWVSAWRHKPGVYGRKKADCARIFIPKLPEFDDSPAGLVDHVAHHLRLLVAMLRPQRPPKGWRLFSRRPR